MLIVTSTDLAGALVDDGAVPRYENLARFIAGLVENGALRQLEGYSYVEQWPDSVSKFHVGYISGGKGSDRDWVSLRKDIESSQPKVLKRR